MPTSYLAHSQRGPHLRSSCSSSLALAFAGRRSGGRRSVTRPRRPHAGKASRPPSSYWDRPRPAKRQRPTRPAVDEATEAVIVVHVLGGLGGLGRLGRLLGLWRFARLGRSRWFGGLDAFRRAGRIGGRFGLVTDRVASRRALKGAPGEGRASDEEHDDRRCGRAANDEVRSSHGFGSPVSDGPQRPGSLLLRDTDRRKGFGHEPDHSFAPRRLARVRDPIRSLADAVHARIRERTPDQAAQKSAKRHSAQF